MNTCLYAATVGYIQAEKTQQTNTTTYFTRQTHIERLSVTQLSQRTHSLPVLGVTGRSAVEYKLQSTNGSTGDRK